MYGSTKNIVTSFLACIILTGVSGCVSRESTCVDASWIWKHTPKPDGHADGFMHLSEAIINYHASGGDLAAAYSHLMLASNSMKWSGRPYFSYIKVTNDRFLESIKNQEG